VPADLTRLLQQREVLGTQRADVALGLVLAVTMS
jgi:hypothetical protein